MSRELLDVEHRQTVRARNPAHRGQGEVREVLVIDGVELVSPRQPQQMRELERRDTIRLEQVAKPATKSLMSGTCARTLLATMRSAADRWPPAPGRARTEELSTSECPSPAPPLRCWQSARRPAGDAAGLRTGGGSRRSPPPRPRDCWRRARTAPPCRPRSVRRARARIVE